jgi:hypothetical protein
MDSSGRTRPNIYGRMPIQVPRAGAKQMFKVIVAGGRDFKDYPLLKKTLDKLLKHKTEVQIVSGLAKGADSLALEYAVEKNLPVKKFPANWNEFGTMAGYQRNIQMAQYADACVCFWNGKSRGTKHMIRIARESKLQVRTIKY